MKHGPSDGGMASGYLKHRAPAESGDARSWLKKAIARHERHMNGSEPTSKASQMKMMDEMKAALAAMGSK